MPQFLVAEPGLGGFYDRHGEKFRYLLVGLGNSVLAYGLFLALLSVLGPRLSALVSSPVPIISLAGRDYYVLIQWIGWLVFVPVSTLTLKYLAFRSRGRCLHQVGKAFLVYLPSQGLSSLLLWLTVQKARLSPEIGQLVTIAFVAILSYFGHKYFTFRPTLSVGEIPPEETTSK